MPVPWCADGVDFGKRHLQVRLGSAPRFWIWQAEHADGDHVRFGVDGQWRGYGEPIDGCSGTRGVRTLVVYDDAVQLLDLPADIVASIRSGLCTNLMRSVPLDPPAPEREVASVPRLSASAFSIAGPASDANNTVYRDSGKRYGFQIENGVVVATHPDGRRELLTNAISYDRKRAGESLVAPRFDMVAANGNRVFAKQQGRDAFWFTCMDETFMHRTGGRVVPVPSTYFKVDPEAGRPDAKASDLTRHLDGAWGNHPAAAAFPVYRLAIQQQAIDMMVVRVRPRTWHLIDARPSLGALSLELALLDAVRNAIVSLAFGRVAVRPVRGRAAQVAAQYERVAEQIKGLLARRWSTRRDRLTGSRPTRTRSTRVRAASASCCGRSTSGRCWGSASGTSTSTSSTSARRAARSSRFFSEDVRLVYRIFNGPVDDGDGYIDGTCSFYALVELAPGARSATRSCSRTSRATSPSAGGSSASTTRRAS